MWCVECPVWPVSPSIRSTVLLRPSRFCASASEVIVLLSPGTDDVEKMTCGGLSTLDNRRGMHRLRIRALKFGDL